jgi:hypothetical protein
MQNAESCRNGICRKSIINSCIAKQYKKIQNNNLMKTPWPLKQSGARGLLLSEKIQKRGVPSMIYGKIPASPAASAAPTARMPASPAAAGFISLHLRLSG